MVGVVVMEILFRLKILLWFPFIILFFPMLIILGKEKTCEIGDWIHDI
jgi:hypothetical protein